jgi:hypothetical protein
MLKLPTMANLDAIFRELKHERDRLDAAIKALSPLGDNSRTRTGA